MKNYKQGILYLIFGGLTTAVNIAVYYLLFNWLSLENVPSTVIAWVASVLFAFVTNKNFVFESKEKGFKNIFRQITAFFGCRLLTGVMDVAIMWVAVDLLEWNSLVWKIISNVLVIVLNYFASKLLIFKKK